MVLFSESVAIPNPTAVYFPLLNRSPARVVERVCHCPLPELDGLSGFGQYSRGARTVGRYTPQTVCTCKTYRLTEADKSHNEEVERLYRKASAEHLHLLRRWMLTYLADRDAFRAGERTENFEAADGIFLYKSYTDY